MIQMKRPIDFKFGNDIPLPIKKILQNTLQMSKIDLFLMDIRSFAKRNFLR